MKVPSTGEEGGAKNPKSHPGPARKVTGSMRKFEKTIQKTLSRKKKLKGRKEEDNAQKESAQRWADLEAEEDDSFEDEGMAFFKWRETEDGRMYLAGNQGRIQDACDDNDDRDDGALSVDRNSTFHCAA